MDQLLTMVSIYWFTGTISSANNMYKAGQIERSGGLKPGQRVEVPTGYTEYPQDLDGVVPPLPRSWAERGHNIVHYATMPRGGHFAAMTEPELFADDVRAFASKLRQG
jgi:pimeloyl-ACP methyl ester carboxylesterase